jgi:hypothetical protein
VAAGAAAGANALVGGFDRSFTLQPLSVEGAATAVLETLHGLYCAPSGGGGSPER